MSNIDPLCRKPFSGKSISNTRTPLEEYCWAKKKLAGIERFHELTRYNPEKGRNSGEHKWLKRLRKQAVQIYIKSRFKKKPPTGHKLPKGWIEDEVLTEFYVKQQPEADRLKGIVSKWSYYWQAYLETVASDIEEIPSCEQWHEYYYASDNSTQTQPDFYANIEALYHNLEPRKCGLKTQIVRKESGYVVEVQCERYWFDAIKEKGRVCLLDKVAFILRRGGNPRVFYPLLPHGWEESVGLFSSGTETLRWTILEELDSGARFKAICKKCRKKRVIGSLEHVCLSPCCLHELQ